MKIPEVSKTNEFFSFRKKVINVMNEIKCNLLQEIITKPKGKKAVANCI